MLLSLLLLLLPPLLLLLFLRLFFCFLMPLLGFRLLLLLALLLLLLWLLLFVAALLVLLCRPFCLATNIFPSDVPRDEEAEGPNTLAAPAATSPTGFASPLLSLRADEALFLMMPMPPAEAIAVASASRCCRCLSIGVETEDVVVLAVEDESDMFPPSPLLSPAPSSFFACWAARKRSLNRRRSRRSPRAQQGSQ